MEWYHKIILIVSILLAGVLLSGVILSIINGIVEKQSGLTNKRKEKYFKNKEKQIIEQLEFEKGVYVRKVKIEKIIYRYVFFTRCEYVFGIVYPQLFETLDELVEHIKKLEKKGKSK